jgi:hypothetical protein
MTNVKPGDNLQAVVNSAGVGATINAAAGSYAVNVRVNLLSGQTLTGSGAVFKGGDNDVFGVHSTSDVTIDGVTIDGGTCGVIGNSATRLKVRNCTLKNQGGGGVGCGVWVLAPVDCEVTNNKFINVGFGGSEARGVFTQDSRGTKVDHNDFADCVSAVHAYWFGDAKTPHKCTFNFNKCHGKFAWHCLEIQYAANTIEIVGNDIRDLGPAAFGMGISCATGGDPNKKRPNGDPGGGGGGGSPVITNVKATEANPPVVTWTGGAATITRTDQQGKTDVKPDGSPAVFPNAVSPFTDTFIPQEHYDIRGM